MDARERIRQAMSRAAPEPVPVMCQLSIGHILVNAGVDPLRFNFTNDGFAQGLLAMQARYGFDGILIHKPGRDRGIFEQAEVVETERGHQLSFPDGGAILCPDDEDPRYLPPRDYRPPTPDDIDPDALFTAIPESLRHWRFNCGLFDWRARPDVPGCWFECIDRIREATGETLSVHGEVNSPFDAIFHLLRFEDVLTGLLTHPTVIHALLDALTEPSIRWGIAQVERGCDAIKLSSPWAGSGFISREHYRAFVLPYERRVVQAIQHAGGRVYTHTCGAIGDRLDLIAASGVDGLECLDPPPVGDVRLAEAKAEWGDRLFIKGNVDPIHTLLRGTPDSVRADVRERLRVGAHGGGFILSSACSVAPDTPPENVQTLVRMARAFKAP